MDLPTYFDDFLVNIRPSEKENADFKKAHEGLRENIENDEDLKKVMISTFLQGSYRRKTAITAAEGKRSDVDIVAVTKIHREESPRKALEYFEPFCERHYKGCWKRNDRSIGINVDTVSLDLVVTAAPSEGEEGLLNAERILRMDKIENTLSEFYYDRRELNLRKSVTLDEAYLGRMVEASARGEEWQSEPLLIPDRSFDRWEETHPLAQIFWTREKNLRCNGHYINVVKAIKWWRRLQTHLPDYPKGYPIEALIGSVCPNDITTIAEGLTIALETIARNHARKPFVPDHGVPAHDVLARVGADDYSAFYGAVTTAATIARRALDAKKIGESAKLWQELFGSDKFPSPDSDDSDDNGNGGFSKRTEVSTVSTTGRYA